MEGNTSAISLFFRVMTSRLGGRWLSCALLLLLAASWTRGEKLRNHFDSDAPGREPAFFDFLVLAAPGEAQWKVVAGHNPPSAPNHVSQIIAERPGDSIAVALRRSSFFRDGTWSLALKRAQGRGGIVFRMAGEKDFCLVLVDLATGEARLSAYRKGHAADLASGQAKLANEWATLSIEAAGPKVSARWDGKPLLEATDPSPVAGRSGMATAGPGIVSFDEFVLDPAREDSR
jgi:hypothetical protein